MYRFSISHWWFKITDCCYRNIYLSFLTTFCNSTHFLKVKWKSSNHSWWYNGSKITLLKIYDGLMHFFNFLQWCIFGLMSKICLLASNILQYISSRMTKLLYHQKIKHDIWLRNYLKRMGMMKLVVSFFWYLDDAFLDSCFSTEFVNKFCWHLLHYTNILMSQILVI